MYKTLHFKRNNFKLQLFATDVICKDARISGSVEHLSADCKLRVSVRIVVRDDGSIIEFI